MVVMNAPSVNTESRTAPGDAPRSITTWEQSGGRELSQLQVVCLTHNLLPWQRAVATAGRMFDVQPDAAIAATWGATQDVAWGMAAASWRRKSPYSDLMDANFLELCQRALRQRLDCPINWSTLVTANSGQTMASSTHPGTRAGLARHAHGKPNGPKQLLHLLPRVVKWAHGRPNPRVATPAGGAHLIQHVEGVHPPASVFELALPSAACMGRQQRLKVNLGEACWGEACWQSMLGHCCSKG